MKRTLKSVRDVLLHRNLYVRRITAAFSLPLFLCMILSPGMLLADPVFSRYQDASKKNLDSYMDRADHLVDEQAWSNYVLLGVASEQASWEQTEFEKVTTAEKAVDRNKNLSASDKDQEKFRLETLYNTARQLWLQDEAADFYERRGQFRAQKAAENIQIDPISENEYNAIIAKANAAVSAFEDLDVDLWDTTIATDHAALVQNAKASMKSKLDNVRGQMPAMSSAEQAAFLAELDKIQQDQTNDFTIRDNFYITRGRNQYIALKRADDISSRYSSDQTAADQITQSAIESTQTAVNQATTDSLAAAVAGAQSALTGPGADATATGANFDKQIQATIQAGLAKWSLAEQDLYTKRIAWMEETKQSRAAAEQIWKTNQDRLTAARDAWLNSVQKQISDGRALWDQKYRELTDSRKTAEDQLAKFITDEKARRDSVNQQLSSIVNGGGSALLQAKDAFKYYDDLITKNNCGDMCSFYKDQRAVLSAAIGNFELILTSADGVVGQQMYSNSTNSGLLVDRRLYAQDLPQKIQKILTANFKSGLQDLMSTQSEDFVLYRKDMNDLITANSLFVKNSATLKSSGNFNYNDAGITDLIGLMDLMDTLGGDYAEQKAQFYAIVNRVKDPKKSDPENLAAVRLELDHWFSLNTDENARLQSATLQYFQGGAQGYYLSGNNNEPYLMTQAEYQWELLRRQRDYLAQKLASAAEVKRYAELAAKHHAGLEFASVTEDRAIVAQIHADLTDLIYMTIKGDLSAQAGETVDQALLRILATKSIDQTTIQTKTASLNEAIGLLNGITSQSAPDDAGIDSILSMFEAYLAKQGTNRNQNVLSGFSAKLTDYKQKLVGADQTTRDNLWTAIKSLASDLSSELQKVTQDYDVTGFNTEIGKLRTAIANPGVTVINGQLSALQPQMDKNAQDLAAAKVILDQKSAQYRQAYLDFQTIVSSPASLELLKQEILDSTNELAGLLNNMQAIENVPGMAGHLANSVETKRLEYINTIANGEKAKTQSATAAQALSAIQGLNQASARLKAANDLKAGNNNFNGKTPLEIAGLLLAQKSVLAVTNTQNPELSSHPSVTTSMDALQAARTKYDDLVLQLSKLDASDAANADQIASLTFQKLESENGMRDAEEALFAALQAEEAERQQVFNDTIARNTIDVPQKAEEIQKTGGDAQNALLEKGADMAQDAAQKIRDFLSSGANRGKTYAQLMNSLSAQIAALSAQVGMDTNRVGGNLSQLERDLMVLRLAGSWLSSNKSAIDAANKAPEHSSDMTVDEKWDALIKATSDMAKDSVIHDQFMSDLPLSNSDSRVQAVIASRKALLAILTSTLSLDDSALYQAYLSLGSADRAVVQSYGPVNPTDTRAYLSAIQEKIAQDLASQDGVSLYLRDQIRLRSAAITPTINDLNTKAGQLATFQNERRQLAADLATLNTSLPTASDPAAVQKRIDDMTARIAYLDSLISPLASTVQNESDAVRAVQGWISEAQQRGSSSALLSGALQLLSPETAPLQEMQTRLQSLSALQKAPTAQTAADSIKAAIGFYKTDAGGNIVRDANGKPVVSADFGGMADSATLEEIFSSASMRNGNNLLEKANAIEQWIENNPNAPPEIRAAADALEKNIREVLIAEEYIKNRERSADDIIAISGDASKQNASLSEKAQKAAALENQIQQAIQNAQMNQADIGQAVLAVLTKSENVQILNLFNGQDAKGVTDNVSDSAAQAKVLELVKLARALSEANVRGMTAQAGKAYANAQAQYASQGLSLFLASAKDRNALLDNPEISAKNALDLINGIAGDAGFRQALQAKLSTLNSAYSGEILGVLLLSSNEGQALKDEIKSDLVNLKTAQIAELQSMMDQTDAAVTRNIDLKVTTGVAELMGLYAQRATFTKTNLLPGVTAIDTTMNLTAVINALSGLLTSKIDGAAYASIRRQILQLAMNATNSVDLKAQVIDYINGLSDPPAQDVAKTTDELYEKDLLESLASFSSADHYTAGNFPAELRNFLLVREYNRAKDAYQTYQDALTNGEKPVLDLTSLNGDFARWVLFQDYDAYAATNSFQNFMANRPDEKITMAEYLSDYLSSRRIQITSAQYTTLCEHATQAEYLRIKADATAGPGLAKLDETKYGADFQNYLLLSKISDYMQNHSLSITGATTAEKRASFQAIFDSLLSDNSYSVNGQNLGQRLLGENPRKNLFETAFAMLSVGLSATDYLPSELSNLQLMGKLDTVKTASEFLPADLLGIAGYATANARDLLANVGSAEGNHKTAEIYAHLEVLDKAGTLDMRFLLSDSEIGSLIAKAGYAGASAQLQTDLANFIKNRNKAMLAGAGQAQSVDQALQMYRQNLTLMALYPDRTQAKEVIGFISANANLIGSIESKFFFELGTKSQDLQNLAKENRGDFIASLIARSQNQASAYYSGLSASQKSEMDVLVQKLFGASGRFSTDEQSFLKTQTGDVQKAFALRSAQELVTSGLFESAGAALFASLDAQGMSAAEKADRAQNQNAYLRAFVESLYAGNQVGTLSQASSDFLASHAGLAAKIATAISVMDPNLKNVLLSETVLLNRFFTQFQESDADRNAIVSALTDPTVLGLGADLSTTLEADRDLVLSQTEAQGLLASISGTVSSHVRFFADKQREYSRKKEVADSMLTFAQKLGSSKPADAASYQDARVQNWRTYSGSEAAYRDTAYANYEKDYATQLAAYNADPTKNPYPGPKLSANEYFNALSLNVTSVNNGKTASEILDGDYAGNLLSDDPAGTIPVQIDDPDHPGQKKTVYVNKYGAVTVNATSSADFKEVYYANLANNYIDAISHLSASLSGIVEAANLADSRANADTDEITKLATIANDAANTDNAKKEAAILAEQQLRQSEAAANGDQQITQVQSDFGSAIGATAKAQDDYASAGRRSLINRIGSQKYMKDILDAASKELADAQATVKTLSDASATLQLQYNTLVGDYTNRMNDMAAAFREFTARNKEAQTRQDIKDFASTPYLYLADNAASTTGLAANVGDAQAMFNSAKTALDAINKQLTAAADLVFAQDHMSDFATVAAGVSSAKKAGTDPASLYPPLSTAEAKTLADLRAKAVKLVDDQGNKIAIDGTTGTPLSVSERDQLTALTQRELYANYADVFTTRAEFLEQSLRTIRIEKAAAILQSEIAKRSAEAQQAKTDFTSELNSVFMLKKQDTAAKDAGLKQAQFAVYNRLKNILSTGNSSLLYNEWRAWFWGSKEFADKFASELYGAWVGNNPEQLKATPTQIAEGAIGMTIAHQLSEADQKAIGTFVSAGGTLAQFSGFSGVYSAFIGSLGVFDSAVMKSQITMATFIPAIGVGTGMVVTGQMLVAQGTALALVGVGLPMINSGYVMIAGGTSLIRLSMQKLAEAATQLSGATWNMQWAQGMALNAGNDVSDIRRVMAKEVTYNNAQAALDYFTKIPDLKTMKERLIAWGKNHADDPNEKPPGSALYNLTDDDIKYLYDTIAGNLDSTGKPVNLSGNDATIALDVTGKKQLTDFTDSMGRRYDPSTLTATQPGPLDGGAYVGAGNVRYTKVTVMSDDGLNLTEKYAVILETDPNATGSAANQRASYNLLDILPMLVNKMETIRDSAKSAYLAAGQGATSKTGDSTFTLNEQSETLQEVFVAATNREDGGREFAGYTNAYNDFSQNAKAISDQELAQREALQKQEWDLKQQDFLDRRAEWETKIANILDRGKKEWAENQSKFLQQWDDWEKGFDKDTKDGQATWDAKMAQFFTDRAKWKSDITIQSARATATNTLTSTINDLNSQLAQFAENTGMASRSIDLQATLAQAYASIEKTMPTNTDRLRDINNDISNFNTQLALSQMSGQNLTSSISGLQNQLNFAMAREQNSMKILAGVQMFEQYRKIRQMMTDQLEDQNRSIDRQTTADAAASGYVRQGDVFVKPGKDGAFFTAINAYTYFDVQGNMSQELSRAGFAEMSSDAMQNFLSSKSEVEMDSYFSMQKTALQVAMENITGHGSQTERKKSQDTYVIGTFNKWAGSAGDSNDQFVASHVFANDQILGLGFNSFLTGGFGELGSGSARPGGAPYGFYVQLALSGYSFNQEGSRRDKLEMGKSVDMSHVIGANAAAGSTLGMLANAGDVASAIMTGNYTLMGNALANMGNAMASGAFGTASDTALTSLAPIATMINQFDPAAMVANSKYNMDYGHHFYDKSQGYMLEANVLNSIKAPLTTAGSLVTTYAVLGDNEPFTKGMLMVLGSLMTFAGSSINVNPTTGERLIKATDQSVITTAVSVVGALLAGGVGDVANLFELGETATMMLQAATSATLQYISGTVNYDEHGASHGMSMFSHGGDFHGEQALAGAAVGFATGLAGGSVKKVQMGSVMANSIGTSFAKGALGVGINTMAEFAKQSAWGAEHSGFGSLENGALGGFLGMLAGGFAGGEIALDKIEQAKKNPAHLMAIASDMPKGMDPIAYAHYLQTQGLQITPELADAIANLANQNGQNQSKAQILEGLAYREEENQRLLDATKGETQHAALNPGTNVNDYINNLAAYHNVDPAVMQESLLQANGANSIEELQAKVASGQGLTEVKGFGWTQEFQDMKYPGQQQVMAFNAFMKGDISSLPPGIIQGVPGQVLTINGVRLTIATDGSAVRIGVTETSPNGETANLITQPGQNPQQVPGFFKSAWNAFVNNLSSYNLRPEGSLPGGYRPEQAAPIRFSDDLFKDINLAQQPGEDAVARNNRVLESFREISSQMTFANGQQRDMYIAHVAKALVTAFQFDRTDGLGLRYGVDGPPSNFNPITARGRADLDKGIVDCSQYSSMVLYAANITQALPGGGNAFALNEYQPNLFKYDYGNIGSLSEDLGKLGAANHLHNETVFEQTPGNQPTIGSFGVYYNLETKSSQHVYVVLDISEQNTLTLAESGSGGNGVRIRQGVSIPDKSIFLRVKDNFNAGQLR